MKTTIKALLLVSLSLTACGSVNKEDLVNSVKKSLEDSMAKDEAYAGVELKDVVLERESGSVFKGWAEYQYGKKLEKVQVEVRTSGEGFELSAAPPTEIFVMKTFGITELPATGEASPTLAEP